MRRLLCVTPVLALTLLAGCSDDGTGTASDPAVTPEGGSSSAAPLDPAPFVAPTAAVDPVAAVSEVPASEMPVPVVEDDAVTSMTWQGVPDRDNNGDVLLTYLSKGDGPALTAASSVSAQYYGTLPGEDTEFDSSFKAGGAPVDFPLSGVIQGWKDGLTGVPVGSKVVLGIPSRYAYGETGGGGGTIPANAYLYFYVEVVNGTVPKDHGFIAPTEAPDKVARVTETPATEMPQPVLDGSDVTGLTWDGVPERDNNGDVLLTYLSKGTGAPLTPQSTVTAHYYGSLPEEEKPFDDSFSRGEPAAFPLTGVIQGWKDGLTGVPVGSKVLLGIPSRYAYGEAGQGDIPANAYLYFYVEVVSAT